MTNSYKNQGWSQHQDTTREIDHPTFPLITMEIKTHPQRMQPNMEYTGRYDPSQRRQPGYYEEYQNSPGAT